MKRFEIVLNRVWSRVDTCTLHVDAPNDLDAVNKAEDMAASGSREIEWSDGEWIPSIELAAVDEMDPPA